MMRSGKTIFPDAQAAAFLAALAGPEAARPGINAAAIGTHRSGPRRRHCLDLRDQAAAAEALIQSLPAPGETVHAIMDGNFTLASVIPLIQRQIGEAVDLDVTTLGLNLDTADLLAAMLDAGQIHRLRLGMSEYFKRADAKTADTVTDTLKAKGAVVGVWRIHAKLQLYRPATKPDRVVLETSSNLRSAVCLELVAIHNDPALFEWHQTWLNRLFDTPPL